MPKPASKTKPTHAPAPAQPTAAQAPAQPAPAATLTPSPLALALAAPRQHATGGGYAPPVRVQYAPGARVVGGQVAAHTYTVAPQWLTACPARAGTYRAQFWGTVQANNGKLCSAVTAQVPIVTWAYWLQAAAAGHVTLHCATTKRRVVPGQGGKGYTYAAAE